MSKVILITGGSSGIGKAIGDYLVTQNFIVYGTSRTPEKYTYSNFNLLPLDVTQSESITLLVSKVIEKEAKIDVLINNAGVGITGPVEETPIAEIKKAFNTNFYGPLALTEAVLPYMRQQKQGLIINITSIAGYMGLPYRGIYSATKAALEITTEAYRMELKSFGINMTCIAPGDFATNIAAGRYHAPVLQHSPYKEPYSNTLKIINEHVNQAASPVKVAKTILKIINTKNPKVHYKVGSSLQKFSIVLKKILPDRWYEKMLLKHYNL